MAKFTAITMQDMANMIPGWRELAFKSPLDMANLAKMFEALDNYAEQNGMQFFQVHHRRCDNTAIAIFILKE
ncbi:MAG: hypothetical protein V1904_15420 [Bacteroidota bacterium]